MYQLKDNQCSNLVDWDRILQIFHRRIPKNIQEMRKKLQMLKKKTTFTQKQEKVCQVSIRYIPGCHLYVIFVFSVVGIGTFEEI